MFLADSNISVSVVFKLVSLLLSRSVLVKYTQKNINAALSIIMIHNVTSQK